MALIDMYCVSDHEPDVVMWVDAALTWGEVYITSVSDMVEKVQKRCSKGDRIRELTIVGHGNETGQHVGRDWLCEETLRGFTHELGKLRAAFGRGSTLILGGCQVGQNAGLLLRLAEIVGAPVVAYMANQRPVHPGGEGRQVQCYISCTRGGSDFWEKVDVLLGQD